MKRIKNSLWFFLFFFLLTTTLSAQIVLPHIFNDNMVLQRDQPIKIWGQASPRSSVTTTFHGQSLKAVADNNGKWSVTFQPVKYGGPFEMTISGSSNKITYKNVLVGDVWICSGQSNMEFPVSGWSHINNHEYEIAHANYPSIRLFTVKMDLSVRPEEDVKGGVWQECRPSTISPFSAVAYFFGRELYQSLKIPIGLLFSSWGGTDIESWISRNSLDTSAEFSAAVKTLPRLNMDSLNALHKGRSTRLVEKIQGQLPDAASIPSWKTAAFDDHKWPTMRLPGLWDDQQLGGDFDGEVWLRKEFDWKGQAPNDTIQLSLGMIDDNDETFVNGIPVGATQGYNLRRIYKIPPGVIHEGKNTIAIKVNDTGGGGGVYGDSKDLYITFPGNTISLAGQWTFQVSRVMSGNGSFGPNSYPSVLFNAMINPLTPFAIKGAIWYQGENNAKRGYQYRKAMPLLIEDWRNHWKQKALPFYYVQLANFNAANGNSNTGSPWAELRESQTLALSVPNTGMAVAIDLGESHDIHPKNKQDVGKRLAALALKNTYSKPIVASGPSFGSMTVKGNRVELTFTDIGSGLTIKGDQLVGFEIAGKDRKFYPATATLTTKNLRHHPPQYGIEVFAAEVQDPVSVRYAWADDPVNANLYNKEGFPAIPFRTDHWPEITRDVKYHIDL